MEESNVEKKETTANWVKMKPAEIEKIVVELAKSGESPAKIGLILRDKHGIPKAKLLGKKIEQILLEHNVKYFGKRDVADKKVTTLKTHLGKNHKDYCAKRSLGKNLWVLHKLEKTN